MFEKAAAQGHSGAQYNLGYMYHNGQGVRQDYRQARQWYEKAAEQGDAQAQYNLGVMYFNGDGAPRNFIMARRCFELAAALEYQDALLSLSFMDEKGL